MWHQDFIFQILWKIKTKKTEVTLSLILQFNLRLRGYSIWSASTSRTIYDQDFGAWPPHSLGAVKGTIKTTQSIQEKGHGALDGCPNRLNYSKTSSQVLDACRTRLRRAQGLVRPGVAGLLIGIECSRVRDSAWIYLTSFITTRIAVELVVVQGNYPFRLYLDSNIIWLELSM